MKYKVLGTCILVAVTCYAENSVDNFIQAKYCKEKGSSTTALVVNGGSTDVVLAKKTTVGSKSTFTAAVRPAAQKPAPRKFQPAKKEGVKAAPKVTPVSSAKKEVAKPQPKATPVPLGGRSPVRTLPSIRGKFNRTTAVPSSVQKVEPQSDQKIEQPKPAPGQRRTKETLEKQDDEQSARSVSSKKKKSKKDKSKKARKRRKSNKRKDSE